MTEFHYFSSPSDTDAGTLNPVYELLDFPIAMGRADDVVLTGPAPEKPLVDGREVTDPRLIAALSVPVELDRAEALDRSAKLAGVLRTMGVIPESGAVLTLAEDVPPLARALTLLAAARIGLRVDLRAEAGEATETAVVVHGIDAPTIEPGRASVRITRSRFEGVGVSIDGQTANLDQAMRDSRVEFAAVVPLSPEHTLLHTDAGAIDAQAWVDWFQGAVLSGS